MIICYGLIVLEAMLIVILFLKIHDVYSELKILRTTTINMVDKCDRLLDTWQQSINNADTISAIAKDILARHEELMMRLDDKK